MVSVISVLHIACNRIQSYTLFFTCGEHFNNKIDTILIFNGNIVFGLRWVTIRMQASFTTKNCSSHYHLGWLLQVTETFTSLTDTFVFE